MDKIKIYKNLDKNIIKSRSPANVLSECTHVS